MPLCRTCGTEIENNTKKCPHCGASPFASPEKGLSLIKRLVLVLPIACWLGGSVADSLRFIDHTNIGRQLRQTFPIDPGVLFYGLPWIGSTIGLSFVLAYVLKTSSKDGEVPFGWKLILGASFVIFAGVVFLYARVFLVWANMR
ncbi:hypothetical protein CA54_05460 [Symmachiella macrocystis]|uniref:Zinc-ribbon domain-containing protein n=1 Tax=Symmachiella macrocystis TaxID=2527985 RepID=A0A5C6BJ81_9PLAN|nr:zinc ribbon domain-containing protein [Symmachiella macrocystis]TWU11737.1 hypothetical protein CA54_05460 [Symmachiella macrocystis]